MVCSDCGWTPAVNGQRGGALENHVPQSPWTRAFRFLFQYVRIEGMLLVHSYSPARWTFGLDCMTTKVCSESVEWQLIRLISGGMADWWGQQRWRGQLAGNCFVVVRNLISISFLMRNNLLGVEIRKLSTKRGVNCCCEWLVREQWKMPTELKNGLFFYVN